MYCLNSKYKRVVASAFCLMHIALSFGQSYAHDATKKNQITVQEIGTGTLTPAAYYSVLHNEYQRHAAEKNKLSFRTTSGLGAYMQIDDAEKLDSALVKRAEIEALNVVDRTGGEADLAWLAEGEKITDKMSSFKANIDRITALGGNPRIRTQWLEYYNMYNTALKSTQQAYMPNSQRKKEYLRIYADLLKRNDTLVRYLVRLSGSKRTASLLNVNHIEKLNEKASIVANAYGRWREASIPQSE